MVLLNTFLFFPALGCEEVSLTSTTCEAEPSTCAAKLKTTKITDQGWKIICLLLTNCINQQLF